jgi:hypothetical protein
MPSQPEADYQWRETYFVWFDSTRRPKLDDVKRAIRNLHGHYEVSDASADEKGLLESITVVSPDDHAALEITYLVGEDIREEGARLATEITPSEEGDRQKLARLHKYDARLDVMHFEEVPDDLDDEDDMLDPGALLIVLDALVALTHGVGVDPQSGTVM